MADKPKARSSLAEKELEKVEEQFNKYDENIKQLTHDRMASAPKEEVEQQTKLSQNQILDAAKIYLKPKTSLFSREKFNERFREDYNFQKEYVNFIAENVESPGDTITLWTKPFPGCPAEEWVIPVNKPIWGPRYVAERVNGCEYSRLQMDDSQVVGGSPDKVQYMGQMVIDRKLPRLKAVPTTTRKSIFIGASGF